MQESNYICILETNESLSDLIRNAILKGINFSHFKEPDLDNIITAIVLEACDESRRLCSRYRLALKEKQ